jgi:hypothetical protein
MVPAERRAHAAIRPKSTRPDLDRENRQFVVDRRWMAVKFEMINTEPVDVAGQIQIRATHHFVAQGTPSRLTSSLGAMIELLTVSFCKNRVLVQT